MEKNQEVVWIKMEKEDEKYPVYLGSGGKDRSPLARNNKKLRQEKMQFSTRSIVRTELLIELVKNYPFLYNAGHPDYKNRIKKKEIWRNIAKELNSDSNSIKNKWKNLRDSYIKFKHFTNGSTGETAKKYKSWQWSNYMKFLDDSITMCTPSSNVVDSESSDLEIDPPSNPLADDGELSMTSWDTPSSPKRNRRNESSDDVDAMPDYFKIKNPNRNTYDVVDHLFLSYAQTFKRFSARRQALLKVDLATLFSRAEICELDEQNIPAPSENYSSGQDF